MENDEILVLAKVKKSDIEIIAEIEQENDYSELFIKNEKASFLSSENINIRESPHTTSKKIDLLKKGEIFNYDSVYKNQGYVWVSGYLNNTRVYLVCGKEKNGKNVKPYGKFY